MATPKWLIFCVVLVLVNAWPWANKAAEGPLKVVDAPIDVGQPVLIQDLAAFETRCFKAKAPPKSTIFRALASVVALAGSPALSGGWQPARPAMNSSEAGYETLDQLVANPEKKSEFFFCLTTFSSQGCDSILTVHLSCAEEPSPLVQLRPNFPLVWPHGDQAFILDAEVMEDIRVTALPVSGGKLNVTVFHQHSSTNCSGFSQHFPVTFGAAIVDLRTSDWFGEDFAQDFRKSLCIRVTSEGDVLLVAGPRIPGPFLVPAIPFVGRLDRMCESARIWVNNGTDVTVTVAADDNSALMLSAMLSTDVQQAPSRWKGLVPPGGNGAALVIEGAKVYDAKLFDMASGHQEFSESKQAARDVAVSLSICRRNPPQDAYTQDTRFWITSVTETGVVTLQDGIPAYASVASGSQTWREFRLLIDGGKVTVAATAQGKVQLVADTKRFPRAPSAFRWDSGKNSSRAVLHLTTEPKLASSEVHLVDCRLPCFLYLAAHAYAWGDEDDVSFTVLATTSTSQMKMLSQGLEVEQHLEPRESQVYSYSLPRNDTAVIVSVTRQHGEASFRLSSSPDFPEGPTTTARADAVILLESSSAPFMSAVQQSNGQAPVLYVRVDGGEHESSSLLCARSEGHAKWLLSGVPIEGAVKEAGRYDRYRFFISRAEANENVTVTVDVSPHRGDVAVYAACDPNQYPWEQHHDWGRQISGQGSLVFNSSSDAFKPGWIYLSITSHELAAYSLRVRWDSQTLQLKDGVPEKSSVAIGAVRWFSLSTSHLLADELHPVSIRAQAFAGVLGICVREYRQISGLGQFVERLGKGLRHRTMSWMEELSCVYSTAATSLGTVEDSIAALDLPVSQGSSIEFGVLGLRPNPDAHDMVGTIDSSDFSVLAVTADVVWLPEVQSVIIDSLGPSCCVKGSLQRSYRRFLRVPSGSLELRVTPLGAGMLLPDTKLSLRTRGQHWSENDWFETVQPLKDDKIDGTLRMKLELKDLVGSDFHRGFWVEAHLEVPAPLNYTLNFQHEVAADEVRLPATRLIADVPIPSNLSKAEFANFTFEGKAQVSHLCLRQCFGQVELKLDQYVSETPSTSTPEDSFSSRGNCTAVTGLSKGALGFALVRKVSPGPSSFEIEFATRPEERIQLVLNFSDFKLCDSSKSCKFSISVSFASASIGLGTSGLASEPQLRYEVLAMEVDPDLHPNTSCGLRAVLEHKRAISTAAVQAAKYSWQHQLQGVLEFDRVHFANESIVVNVLASLVLPEGQIYAVAGYQAMEVVPAMLRTSVKMDHTPAYMLAIVALLLVLWMLSRGRGAKGEARQVPEPIEMAYDLHEEGERSLLEQSGHGGYVPPSV